MATVSFCVLTYADYPALAMRAIVHSRALPATVLSADRGRECRGRGNPFLSQRIG